jgi:lipoprotein-anchoring transpeptidase ErfK/SrfK
MICEVLTLIVNTQAPRAELPQAQVICKDGSRKAFPVVIGAKATPTVVGKYRVFEILENKNDDYLSGAACYQMHPNGSMYCVHRNDKSLPQKANGRASMGCVRFAPKHWAQLRFSTNTQITIL